MVVKIDSFQLSGFLHLQFESVVNTAQKNSFLGALCEEKEKGPVLLNTVS